MQYDVSKNWLVEVQVNPKEGWVMKTMAFYHRMVDGLDAAR